MNTERIAVALRGLDDIADELEGIIRPQGAMSHAERIALSVRMRRLIADARKATSADTVRYRYPVAQD
jgi:hypothetical protein